MKNKQLAKILLESAEELLKEDIDTSEVKKSKRKQQLRRAIYKILLKFGDLSYEEKKSVFQQYFAK